MEIAHFLRKLKIISVMNETVHRLVKYFPCLADSPMRPITMGEGPEIRKEKEGGQVFQTGITVASGHLEVVVIKVGTTASLTWQVTLNEEEPPPLGVLELDLKKDSEFLLWSVATNIELEIIDWLWEDEWLDSYSHLTSIQEAQKEFQDDPLSIMQHTLVPVSEESTPKEGALKDMSRHVVALHLLKGH